MNTRPVPIVIVLMAAAISCVVSLFQGVEFSRFVMRLLITVIVFAFVGLFTKLFLDFIFNKKAMQEEAELEEKKGDNDSNDEDLTDEGEDQIVPGTQEREQTDDDIAFSESDDEDDT